MRKMQKKRKKKKVNNKTNKTETIFDVFILTRKNTKSFPPTRSEEVGLDDEKNDMWYVGVVPAQPQWISHAAPQTYEPPPKALVCIRAKPVLCQVQFLQVCF